MGWELEKKVKELGVILKESSMYVLGMGKELCMMNC